MAIAMKLVWMCIICQWIQPTSTTDCSNELRSKISTACHMGRGITGCNKETLSAQHPLMFNQSGWAQPPPQYIKAIPFCRPDNNGFNKSGVFLHWKIPEHQGAVGIKGFWLTLELYRPDYRCFVIKLKEPVTHSTRGKLNEWLWHSDKDKAVFNVTVYPIALKRIFMGLVYSLPYTNSSKNQSHIFKSSKCANPNTSANWSPQQLNICYYEDTKELNVSFESPPTHFRFNEFTIGISHTSTGNLMNPRTNKTYHVFQSVEQGLYDISVQPYDPHAHDHTKCLCRDEQNRCIGCTQSNSRSINISNHECERPGISPEQTTLSLKTAEITDPKLTNEERDRIIIMAVLVPVGVLGTLLLAYFLKQRYGSKSSCIKRDKRKLSEAQPLCQRDGPSKQSIVLLDLTGVKGNNKTNALDNIQRLLTKLKLIHVDVHTITTEDLQHDLASNKITAILRGFQPECHSKRQKVSPKGDEETVKLSDVSVRKGGNFSRNCRKETDNADRMLLCFAVSNETDTKLAIRFVKVLDDILNSEKYNTLCFKSIVVSFEFVSKDVRAFASECQYYHMLESKTELCSELRTFFDAFDQDIVEQDDAIDVEADNKPDTLRENNNSAEIQEKVRAEHKTAQWLVENNLDVPKRERFFSSDSGRGPSETSFKSSPDDSHENVYESLLPREEETPRQLYDAYVQDASNAQTNIRFSDEDKCPSDVTFFAPDPSDIYESDAGDVLTDAKDLALQNAYPYYNGDLRHMQYFQYANHSAPRYPIPNSALMQNYPGAPGFHGGYIHNPYDYHHVHSDLAYQNGMLEREPSTAQDMRVKQDDSDISSIMDQMKSLNERNSLECNNTEKLERKQSRPK